MHHEGRVLYADHEQLHVLRYEGNIRHPLAPSIGSFVENLLGRLDDRDLVVDLSHAESIDSTNLGELARIADLLSARRGKRASIISTRPEISEVLYSMAFDEVFDICSDRKEGPAGRPIPQLSVSQETARDCILAAHRRLMQMSDSSRQQFSEVVAAMENDAGRG